MPTSSTKASAARSERTRRASTCRKCRRRRSASASRSSAGLREDDPVLADAVLGDLIAHRAPAMLDDGQEARHPIADPLAPHDDDGIGDGPDIPRGHLAGDEVLEPGPVSYTHLTLP